MVVCEGFFWWWPNGGDGLQRCSGAAVGRLLFKCEPDSQAAIDGVGV